MWCLNSIGIVGGVNMSNEEELILDYYAQAYRLEMFSYRMMGKLLETDNVHNRLKKNNITELYIYGGGYLGVQLYNAVKPYVDVKAIVDKSGNLSVNVKGIPVISLDKLRTVYKNEKIIITPIKYYKMIKKELVEFINEDNILYLGEFLEGVI